MKKKRQRLDQLLVERGLAESRAKAQRLILAGAIQVNGRSVFKPGEQFPAEAVLSVAAPEKFVSRGGEKLERAFEAFALEVRNKICLDIGASTGGFTDCLLQHGAAKVYAVDVGRGQLHWKLRNDPRVVIMDNVNARYLRERDFPERADIAVIDVSFISLTKILPAVKDVLNPAGRIITLIKPQFEAGRAEVGRGGVVRSEAVRERVVAEIRAFGQTELGLVWQGSCESPVKGPAGNIEFLACWEKP
ncbi:MAG: TlyA family RNA methyltransferase [Lentisphaerae bacterium]|nr:TlyA family RNA methyltransferase [Lentisphaerota bacterium]